MVVASAPLSAGLEHLWALSGELLCVLDETLTIRATNPAWSRMLGVAEGDLVGAEVHDHVHPDDVDDLVLAAAGESFTAVRARWLAADGSWHPLRWSGVRHGDGQLWAGADQRPHDERRRLLAAQRLANVVSWEYDAEGGQVRLSRDYGDVEVSLDTALAHVAAPADQRVAEAAAAVLAGERDEAVVEARLATPAPAAPRVEIRMRASRGADGRVLRLDGATVAMDAAPARDEDAPWVDRLRSALDEDRLCLFAQPIVDLGTDAVTQHELLVRMRDRQGAIVPPGRFIAAAERHGMIADLDRWVIGQAAAIAGRGHAIQLNLSARSIGQPRLFSHFLRELLRHEADPSLIVVELTETALVANAAAVGAFVESIRALGCRFALDDFGKGYSGFAYLKHLPVDQLKIDSEFIGDLADSDASRRVVGAVVDLARSFGFKTVAEGVEDAGTLGLLRELGVDRAQGYAIARPAPAGELLAG